MVRTASAVQGKGDRVRLAPADWGGLLSVAVALLTVAGATLWQVHHLAATNRERLARIESEITHLKSDVSLLQGDVRRWAYGTRAGEH